MKITNLLGVKINHEITLDAAISLIDKKLSENTFFQICTTNPEFIVDAQKDEAFRNIINKSFLSLSDGSGVVFALEYLEKVASLKKTIFYPIQCFMMGLSFVCKMGKFTTYPPIYGVDLTQRLIELCATKGYSLGLVGGRPRDAKGKPVKNDTNIAKEAAGILQEKFPTLRISFADSNIHAAASYDEESTQLIRKTLANKAISHIDVLLVAFGHIKQEKWIQRNKDILPVHLCVGVGGTLDDIAGYTKIPSAFYSKNNLRWLFRLIHAPWRFKRVLKAVVLFPFLVFVVTLKHQHSLQQ